MTGLSARDLLRMAGIVGLLAAALSLYVGWEEAPLPGDLRLTREIQSWGRLGDNQGLINGAAPWRYVVLVGVTLLVLARWQLGGGTPRAGKQRAEALFAFAAVALLSVADDVLKTLVNSPRPLADMGVRIEEFKSSYGFPSGHVYGNVLIYGALAVMAPVWAHPRLVLPVRAVLIAVIVLSGPARVVVGAHWPSDTLGGYLWGACALLLGLAFARWAAKSL